MTGRKTNKMLTGKSFVYFKASLGFVFLKLAAAQICYFRTIIMTWTWKSYLPFPDFRFTVNKVFMKLDRGKYKVNQLWLVFFIDKMPANSDIFQVKYTIGSKGWGWRCIKILAALLGRYASSAGCWGTWVPGGTKGRHSSSWMNRGCCPSSYIVQSLQTVQLVVQC